MAAMPVNRLGAGQPDGIRAHKRPPVGPEDLNQAQADKVKDAGGLAANVLNRRYGERGDIRECLEHMVAVATNQNVNQCSARELHEIDVIPAVARLAHENSPRYQHVKEDTVREYLRLKKQRKVDREGANWHFRLPELALSKCPILDSFDPASGARFFSWKDVTMKQLDRHAATSAHRLELTKTLVEKKFQILVGHCKEAEEIFDILEHKIPPKSEIARYLEDRITLGGISVAKEGADEMSLFRKAESVQLLLTQLALVEPDFDISKSSVDSCLLSFGSSAGSHMEQAKLTSAWYDNKRTLNQFLSLALDVWLETFKSALGSASATRVRAEKLALVDAAVKTAGSRQGRQGSAQNWQGGRSGSDRQEPPSSFATPSSPPSFLPTAPPPRVQKSESSVQRTQTDMRSPKQCIVCSKQKDECPQLAKCKVLAGWRDKSQRLPANRCSLCLHTKDGDNHKFSPNEDDKVCHWNLHAHKLRNHCCKHKLSRYLCSPCFQEAGERKRTFNPSSQKRMSMKQVFSQQNQTCTSVHLPTVYQQREKVVVCGPGGNDQQALLVYDTGADHSMVSPELAGCDISETSRMAHDVMIIGSIASQSFNLPIVRLDIRSKVEEVPYVTSLNLAVKEMTGEREDPVWHGMQEDLDLKDPITKEDLGLPIILLGVDYISLHPVLCEGPNVHHLPGLVYFVSSFTEKVLPVGRISPMRNAVTENEQLAHTRRAQLSKVGIQTKQQGPEVAAQAEQQDLKDKDQVKQQDLKDKDQDEQQEIKVEVRTKHQVPGNEIRAKKGQDKVSITAAERHNPPIGISPDDSGVEGNFCASLSSLPAIKALAHDIMMNEVRQCWGPVEQSAAISNVSKLGCMSCSAVPQALLDKQDISFF